MLRWLISTYGLAALRGEVTERVRRTGRRAGLFVLAGIFWLLALGFGLSAFTVWLSDKLGVIVALAIIAGILALIALVLNIALAVTAKRNTQSPLERQLSGLAAPAAATAAASGGTLGTLAVVGVLGWLLARQMFRK